MIEEREATREFGTVHRWILEELSLEIEIFVFHFLLY